VKTEGIAQTLAAQKIIAAALQHTWLSVAHFNSEAVASQAATTSTAHSNKAIAHLQLQGSIFTSACCTLTVVLVFDAAAPAHNGALQLRNRCQRRQALQQRGT
jgi:hypothetical protein